MIRNGSADLDNKTTRYFTLDNILMIFTALFVEDTLPWAKKEKPMAASSGETLHPRYPLGVSAQPSTREIFTLVSWRDRCFFAICQAGLVEKFVDALIWVFYPVYLYGKGVSLPGIVWIVGVYGFTWGAPESSFHTTRSHFADPHSEVSKQICTK